MLSCQQTLELARENAYSKWTGSDAGAKERIMKKLCIPAGRQSFTTSSRDTFFTIGSCFARNVEERLELAGANVLSRQIEMRRLGAQTARSMGVFNKYHPYSMLQELEFACGERDFSESCLLPAGGGLYYDGQLRTNSGNASKQELLARRGEIRSFFAQAFSADVLIFTLGLVEAWYDSQSGLYLNDAPSTQLMLRDQERFRFNCLSVGECREVLERIQALLKKHGKPGQKIVITVSPVPLSRTFTTDDIIVANTTSKATLRVAALDFVSNTEGVDYFPSYEAVLHSHPDLAWQNDYLHVSDFIVGNIIRAFLTRYGFELAQPEEELVGHSISEEEKIIRQLNRELDQYKNRIVELETRMAAAGLGPVES